MFKHLTNLKAICKVLGKKYSMEIISHLREGSTYMKKISQDTGIPYTVVQERIKQMERVGLIEVKYSKTRDLGKFMKEVKLNEFNITLSPSIIKCYLEENQLVSRRKRLDTIKGAMSDE